MKSITKKTPDTGPSTTDDLPRLAGDEGDEGRRSGRTSQGALKPGERWSKARKLEVTLRLLRGESVDAVSRELSVESYRLEQWKERALFGISASLRERGDDPLQEELDHAKKRVGELSMENELLRERWRLAAEGRGPLATRRSSR